MTNRERIVNCVLGREIDRTPFISCFGPWGETAARWMSEGAKDGNAWCAPELGFDAGIAQMSAFVNHYFEPCFETVVLDETETQVTVRDYLGIVSRSNKGQSAIPMIVSNPVTCAADWEQIRSERLRSDFASRIPADFDQICDRVRASDMAVQVGNFPFGVFGTVRDLVGVEPMMYLFYDEPELMHRIMDDLTDFWIGIYGEIAKHIDIDIIHIWEDMSGKTGSLISPAMIEEFMLPNYRKIKAFADSHNVPVITVDTDGVTDELIPLFSSAGVNLMLPFEVRAGNDVVELRERFPRMAMLGGIDKMEVAKGREAIERELAHISPLLGKPGYIPQLDHTIPPEISYEDYLYFCRRLREVCGKED